MSDLVEKAEMEVMRSQLPGVSARSIATAAVNLALEAAAERCDTFVGWGPNWRKELAAAIRAMKEASK